jgi:hypothetical protein
MRKGRLALGIEGERERGGRIRGYGEGEGRGEESGEGEGGVGDRLVVIHNNDVFALWKRSLDSLDSHLTSSLSAHSRTHSLPHKIPFSDESPLLTEGKGLQRWRGIKGEREGGGGRVGVVEAV